ncbi:CD82 antigen-like [Pezoporus occidentalis]|uniref:CD82 antigen-like n=1 Tax=Pezoporus occidentalis TaxID=407982 RepID=UPI002F918658
MGPWGCLGLARGFLFLFNSAAVLLGSLLVAFGLWALLDRWSLSWVLGSPLLALRGGAWLWLGVGGGAAALGALGGIGALRGGRVLLGLYFGSLLLLFTAQITVGVIVYTQRIEVFSKMAAHARDLIQGYPAQGPPGEPHEAWDLVQQQVSPIEPHRAP